MSVGEANSFQLSNLKTGEKITQVTAINVFSFGSINCVEPIKKKKIGKDKNGVYFALGDKSSTITFWLIGKKKDEFTLKKIGFVRVPFVLILTIASFWKYSGSDSCTFKHFNVYNFIQTYLFF